MLVLHSIWPLWYIFRYIINAIFISKLFSGHAFSDFFIIIYIILLISPLLGTYSSKLILSQTLEKYDDLL